jgi:hypothetical protein
MGRRGRILIGCVALTGALNLVVASPAQAGVGDCTSGYLSGLDDGGNATSLAFHAGYAHCIALNVDNCGQTDPPATSPFDYAACVIS